MANEVKLQSEAGIHPLDENLRPLKIGDKTAPIELSNTDVKVNNLKVAGTSSGVNDPTKLPLAGGTMTGDITIGSNQIIGAGLTINDSGSVEINADGGSVEIKDADARIFQIENSGSASSLYLRYPDNVAESLVITNEDNGIITISTTAGGTTADLILDVKGDITLDSATGVFIAKDNGTEFSVANSAYAGMILGYTTDGIDAADDSYTLTTSFVVTDSAHKVKFVAPPSGVVEIFVSIYVDLSRRNIYFGLSDNATYNTLDVTHEHIVHVPPSAAGDKQLDHYWVITGLTSGTAYEYWLGAKSTHNLANVLRWGGNVTSEYQPFIMKATALPAAVADYAVYG